MYDDEPDFGPRLWDATPGVCCAAYQLGACPHTEAYDYDDEIPYVGDDREDFHSDI